MRGRAIPLVALLLLAGCASPTEETATAPPPPANFEQKDEGDEGVDVEVEEQDPEVEPELRVTVREPGGQPLSEAQVAVLSTPLSSLTDANGTAVFLNVTAGPARLRVAPAQDYYKVVEVNLTIRGSAVTKATVTVPVADGLLTPPHRHDDAWARGDRVELFEAGWDIDCIGFTAVCQGPDARGRFPAPQAFGAPVPIGTGSLEFTVSYQSPTGSGLGLTLHGPGFATKTLTFQGPGEVDTVEIEPSEWDVAHAMTSAWNMEVTVATTTYQGVWQGPIEVAVVAVRGEADVPLDPPHPDLWGSDVVKRLADQEYSATSIRNPSSTFSHDSVLNINSDLGYRHMDPERLVVPGAAVVQVRAWVNQTAPWPYDVILEIDPLGVDGPDGWPLQYHRYAPADQGAFLEYWVEVDPAWYDGMYETLSKWRYRLLPDYDPATQTSVAALDAHVVIDVHRYDLR